MHQQPQQPQQPGTPDDSLASGASKGATRATNTNSIEHIANTPDCNPRITKPTQEDEHKSSYQFAVSIEAQALIISLDTKVFLAEVAWRLFQGSLLATAAPLLALGLINPLPVMACGALSLLRYIFGRYEALDNHRQYTALSDDPESSNLRPSLTETINDLANIFGLEVPRFIITEETRRAAVIKDLLLINPNYMQRLPPAALRFLLAHELDHIREHSELSKARLIHFGNLSDEVFSLLVSGVVAGVCFSAMGGSSMASNLSMSNWAIISAFTLGGIAYSLLSKASTEFTLWRNRQGETRADLQAIAITGDPDLLEKVLYTNPEPPRELPESVALSRSPRNWPPDKQRIALAGAIKLAAASK